MANRSSLSPPTGRIRVLFYLEYLIGRGEVQAALRLIENLDRTRFEPHLVVNRLIGPFTRRIPSDVPVTDLAIGDGKPWRHLLRLRAYVDQLDPDVCVGVSISPSRLLAALTLLRPSTRVVALQTLFRLEAHKGWFALRRRLTALLQRRVNGTVVGSEVAAGDLVTHLAMRREDVHLIPYPVVDPAIFALARQTPAADLPAGPLVVAVGGLFANKGQRILIEAITKTARPVQLVLIGAGPDKPALERLADRLGARQLVTFLGHQDNPYSYMARADVFVSPSLGEGFDIAHIEALALGIPVIVSDAPRYHVIEDGISGLIVPAGDAHALAAAIDRVLGSGGLRAQLAANGPGAVAHLSSASITRRWERLLSEIARPAQAFPFGAGGPQVDERRTRSHGGAPDDDARR